MENNSLKRTFVAGLTITALSIVVGNVSLASKPKLVEVSIDDEQVKIETSAKTVQDVLNDIGYEFIEGSKINYNLNDKLENNMDIEIDTEKKINFSKAGNLLQVKTFASTVRELLDDQGVKLGKDDIVSPSLDTEIKDGDSVTVDFYTQESYTEEETIEHNTRMFWEFNLNRGESQTTQEGKDGVLTKTFVNTFKNGELISNQLKEEKVTVKAVDELIDIGSKLVEDEAIDYDVVTRESDDLYKGESEIVQAGKEGTLRKTYEVDDEGTKLISEDIVSEPVTKIIEKGTKSRPVVSASNSSRSSSSSSSLYSLGDLRFQGIIYWGGYKYTYYSQGVLPGGGLSIPGRHINAGGFVADGDGYIVLANDRPKGTVLPTPFGYMGKVYDRGTYGNHIDVYTR